MAPAPQSLRLCYSPGGLACARHKAEIAIIGAAVPYIDSIILQHETPLAIRLARYTSSLYWNCIATYSDSFKDTLTSARPAVVVTDTSLHTSANRALCAVQAVITYYNYNLPVDIDGLLADLEAAGTPTEENLDAAMAACGDDNACLQSLAADRNFDPATMGQIVGHLATTFSHQDCWNQLGTDAGCVVNCRSYSDPTGYEPYQRRRGNLVNAQQDRWSPLLEDNGLAFFFDQQHVVPHIGAKGQFHFLPESDRAHRVAPTPTYSRTRRREALAVIERMTTLDDVKKVQIEVLDNKLMVSGSLISSLIGNVTRNPTWVDPDPALKKDGVRISLERFHH